MPRQPYDRPSYAADIRTLLARGLSADQAAKELGISRATLYRILQGR